MKKLLALIICCLTLVTALCGCGNEATKSANQGNEVQQNSEIDPASYIAPAKAVSIDMNAEDPSSDRIKFVYDDEGKVTQCYYNINDNQVYVSYKYDNNNVQIYAFMGDVVVADEVITLSGEYSPEKGFAVIDGYYFKGYDAK